MTQAKTARLDEAALREAALSYVARYGGPEASLRRVLTRRIRRWVEAQTAEGVEAGVVAAHASALGAAAGRVVADLARLGAVNDAAFAESRARRLRRGGGSRRAVLAHLAARGIAQEMAVVAAPEDGEAEFAAALAFARRRRVGPFSAEGVASVEDECEDGAESARAAEIARLRRVYAAFARAGFSADTARRALACGREEAEARLHAAA